MHVTNARSAIVGSMALLCLLVGSGCGSSESGSSTSSSSTSSGGADQDQQPPTPAGPQGVYGKFRVMKGNFMPCGGADCNPGGTTTYPQGVDVFLLRAPAKVRTTITASDTDYVATTKTDAAGVYSFQVDAGSYVVVVNHDGLYPDHSANTDGTWVSIEVKAGSWTYAAISDNRGAVY